MRGGASPMPAFRVEMEFAGLRTTSWVTDTGEVIREESPMGLITVRETPERAQATAVSDRMRVDLLQASSVVPRTSKPIDDPGGVVAMRVRLEGVDLAAAGVGTIGIVEFDEVDESNLQRQIIHGQSDVGRPKAVSAQESVQEINPLVNVVVHGERLDNDNVYAIFEGYDLIVDGTDNFATRYMVNDAAYFLGIPYVWGSIYRFDGQASVYAAGLRNSDDPAMREAAAEAPCYRCLYPEPPPPGMVPSCAEGGVLGVLCASIGSIQVNEAIKMLTGMGKAGLFQPGAMMPKQKIGTGHRKSPKERAEERKKKRKQDKKNAEPSARSAWFVSGCNRKV